MKSFCYTVLLCCLLPLASWAQINNTLYGLHFNTSTSELYFAATDASTGQVTIVNSNPTSQDIFVSGVSDIDLNGGRYFYVRAGRIYTVDIQTGNVLSSPTITEATIGVSGAAPIMNIAYNPLDSTLYGLHFLNSQLRLATLDPGTGVATLVNSAPISLDGFGSGVSDIDPISRRYFYIRMDSIITVSLDLGTSTNRQKLTNPNGAVAPITNIAYNWVTNQIFGLNFVGGTYDAWGNPIVPAELRLASVNPNSGQVTLVSQATVSTDIFQSGVSDINIDGNYYTYVRGAGAQQVISVDLATGNTIWSPPVTGTTFPSPLLTNIAYGKNYSTNTRLPAADFMMTPGVIPNIIHFRNITAYGRDMEWDFGDGSNPHTDRHPTHTYVNSGTYTVTLIAHNGIGSDTITQQVTIGTVDVAEALGTEWQVFPNPAQNAFSIQIPEDAPRTPVNLKLFDLQGRQLIAQTLPSLGAGRIDVAVPSTVANGLYVVQLEQSDRIYNQRLQINR